MAYLFPQTLESSDFAKALCSPVHGAGIQPNIMDHLTHTDLREVLFVN
jgi:hypothetical protein